MVKEGITIVIMLMMIFAAEGINPGVLQCEKDCRQFCKGDNHCYIDCIAGCDSPLSVHNQIYYCKLGCSLHRCSKFSTDDTRKACLDDCSKYFCKF